MYSLYIVALCGWIFEGGFFSQILPWHVANQLDSLAACIPINSSPSPVLGHHPLLVTINYGKTSIKGKILWFITFYTFLLNWKEWIKALKVLKSKHTSIPPDTWVTLIRSIFKWKCHKLSSTSIVHYKLYCNVAIK